MKIQAIKKACLERGTFILVNGQDGRQYICNGPALWPVLGMKLEKDAIPALFDLNAKQQESVFIDERKLADERVSLEPMPSEIGLEDLGLVWEKGCFYRALQNIHGMLYIDCGWLKPIGDGKSLVFCERCVNGQGPLVACYDGLLAAALIAPERQDVMAGRLAEIASARKNAFWENEDGHA